MKTDSTTGISKRFAFMNASSFLGARVFVAGSPFDPAAYNLLQ
jgi:hypothetical protein